MTLTATGPSGSPIFPEDPDAAHYAHLLRRARVTGRCPVWIHPDDLDHRLDRPDDPFELAEAIDAVDVDDVLDRWWPGPCHPTCPCGDPLPPQLPRARVLRAPPDRARRPETFDAAAALAEGFRSGLAVVDAFRPADTPAVLGWGGICNYPLHDLVTLSAVLRQWEARWGALVVALTRSRMTLSVAAPPMYDEECEQVAAEHFAVCPDQQDPQDGTVTTLRSYAADIRGAGSWHFWWD